MPGLPRLRGELLVQDEYIQDFSRTVRVARIKEQSDAILYDVQLLHTLGDLLVLSGFERQVTLSGAVADYAQSWLVDVTC